MMRRAARASGYAAVYVMGPPAAKPVTIGISSNVRDLYRTGQRWREDELVLYGLYWTAGPPLAERLYQVLEALVCAHLRSGRKQWYDVDAKWMCEQIEMAAQAAQVPTFDELERRQRLELAIERALEQIDPTRRRRVQLPSKTGNVVSLHQRLRPPSLEG